MHESPIFILKRIDSRHFSKLWLFYRDYFHDDASCLQFLCDVLKKEPESRDALYCGFKMENEADITDDSLSICEADFIPRRMVNTVERLVSAARDMEQIRHGKDVFKVVFLVTCVETLQNLIGKSGSKRSQLFDFFDNYTNDVDKAFIAENFILEDEENEDSQAPKHDGFKCFIGALNEYRNCAAHEGDYWEYCFNNNNNGYPLSILLNIDLEKFSRNNKKEHRFYTTISYKAFEEIFIRTCIHFIQAYISIEKN